MATTTQAGAPVPAQETSEAPQSSSERYIAALWREIIGLDKVSRSDKFLDLGGNSLTLNVVINRIRLEQGVSIQPQLFFDPDRSSVADIARELDQKVADPTAAERMTSAAECD